MHSPLAELRLLTTTAVIGLVASGALPLPSAIAAILGANVGNYWNNLDCWYVGK